MRGFTLGRSSSCTPCRLCCTKPKAAAGMQLKKRLIIFNIYQKSCMKHLRLLALVVYVPGNKRKQSKHNGKPELKATNRTPLLSTLREGHALRTSLQQSVCGSTYTQLEAYPRSEATTHLLIQSHVAVNVLYGNAQHGHETVAQNRGMSCAGFIHDVYGLAKNDKLR